MNAIKHKIEKIKLAYAMLRYSGSYSQKIIEAFFDKYIGHHKIVRWYDGFPIYSSFVPPLWSDASAHLMGATFFGIVADKQIPFQMNIAAMLDVDIAVSTMVFMMMIELCLIKKNINELFLRLNQSVLVILDLSDENHL